MTRTGQKRSGKQPNERIIRVLAACCSTPAELLELYYWSREPGFVEVIRRIAMMPEETRAVIEAFIALTGDTKSVSADLDGRGVLTLSSVEAAKTIALAQYVAADDADNVSRLLH